MNAGLAYLRTLFGDRYVETAAVRQHHGGGEGFRGDHVPDAVLYAESTEDVALAVHHCANHRFPIIPFGVGTSLEGQVEAIHGGLCIDLSRMDKVLAVSADDLDCRVEAGVTREQLNGYTEISAERFRQQAIFEMREDIAKGLQTIPAKVPGLGGDNGGLLSFGMSLNLKAVREFIEQQLVSLEKDPYDCEYFADLQGGVAQARAGLQQPVPPMVYDFRGFVAVIRDIEGLNMAAQTPPTSVEGQVLLAMNNATALVSLGTMMSPELAGLNLQADGKPVLLDLPQAQMLGQDFYVAMTDDALALSVGDAAEDNLGDMFSAKASAEGTFFSFSMDAARYYGFIAEAMAMQEPDDENPMSPRFKQAMQEMMLAISEIYDRIAVDMRFTDKGIVMDSVVTLGD